MNSKKKGVRWVIVVIGFMIVILFIVLKMLFLGWSMPYGAKLLAPNHIAQLDHDKELVYHVPPFKHLYLDGNFRVVIHAAKNNTVTFISKKNQPKLRIRFSDHALLIKMISDHTKPVKFVDVVITIPSSYLSRITGKGMIYLSANHLHANAFIGRFIGDTHLTLAGKLKKMDIDVIGKTHLQLCDLKVQHLELSSLGEFQGYLTGAAKKLKMKVFGKSTLEAKQLKIEALSIFNFGDSTLYLSPKAKIHKTNLGHLRLFKSNLDEAGDADFKGCES